MEGKQGKNFLAGVGLADNLVTPLDARPQTVEENGFVVRDEDAHVFLRDVPPAPRLPFSLAGDPHNGSLYDMDHIF